MKGKGGRLGVRVEGKGQGQGSINRKKFGFVFEGREGVKWELGFAFFRGWEMGFCALGLGFMKKKPIEKWEWDFNVSNTGWDCGILSWDLKKTISWEMGLGPPFTTLIKA